MTKEKSNADDADRPTEDDIARKRLGGPKGATELKPAPMTRQRRIKMPPDDTEPGHTASVENQHAGVRAGCPSP